MSPSMTSTLIVKPFFRSLGGGISRNGRDSIRDCGTSLRPSSLERAKLRPNPPTSCTLVLSKTAAATTSHKPQATSQNTLTGHNLRHSWSKSTIPLAVSILIRRLQVWNPLTRVFTKVPAWISIKTNSFKNRVQIKRVQSPVFAGLVTIIMVDWARELWVPVAMGGVPQWATPRQSTRKTWRNPFLRIVFSSWNRLQSWCRTRPRSKRATSSAFRKYSRE